MTSVEIEPCSPFPYGRWNNTSTNFKLFPSIQKNQKYYGYSSINQPMFINAPMVNNNILSTMENTDIFIIQNKLDSFLRTV